MNRDDDLQKMAEMALLQEAKRGALRAEMAGPSGWLKPRLPPTNKVFLHNTIKGAVSSNQVRDKKLKKGKEARMEEFEKKLRERKKYRRKYLTASTKLKNEPPPDDKKTDSESNKRKLVNGISLNDGEFSISNAIPIQRKSKSSHHPQRYILKNIKFIPESGKELQT